MVDKYPRATWALSRMVTVENWRELADDVNGAVASVAHKYDPIASGNLIRYFHIALENGALFDQCSNLSEVEKGMIDFVARAFKRYVESNKGTSLDAAFGIARGRGRTSEDNDDRNIMIAARVEQAIRKGKGDTVKIEPVCQEVAESFNLSWKTVEKIYGDFSVSIKTLGDAEISALAEALTK